MTESFNENKFRNDVDEALLTVRRILATTKSTQRAADVPHTYDDKYALVESATDSLVDALDAILQPLGATGGAAKSMRQWVRENKSVTLRLIAEETCTFIKKRERDVEDATKHVTEWESGSSSIASTVKRVFKRVTRITEWLWKFTWDWELIAYAGADPKTCVKLVGRSGNVELITSSESSPRSQQRTVGDMDVNITWFVQRWDATNSFKVNRSATSCHTPRRNTDIETALQAALRVNLWAASVSSYVSSVFSLQSQDKLDMSSINGSNVFLPVTPLMLEESGDAKQKASLLPATDCAAFLAETKRSLEAKLAALKKAFADDSGLITFAESSLSSVASVSKELTQRYIDCINYVEFLIEQQLIAAVGKVVQPKDFAEYMQFHARRLFKAEFAPKPFVYAIRRPDHCPEGELTIDADTGDGSLAQPLHTLTAVSVAKRPWYFALGAASRCSFYGARYLHGGVLHKFANESDAKLQLTARARQFSSFVLLVGKIASADTFEPTHGIIVQNKDDVIVPLMLETIPSAKAFKEAIESMSPEQQRFAKMFRAMQLESTLFGVCIVQIKPQLEKLLNLPYDALTKEIQLTQDLMDLFIQYQIPSDLLAYDGKASAPVIDKVAAVKRQVAQVQSMIQRAKSSELEEVQQEAAYAVIESEEPESRSYSEYEASYDCDEEADDSYASYEKEECAAPMMLMDEEECLPPVQASRMVMREEAQEERKMSAPAPKSTPAPKPVAKKADAPAPKKPEPPKPADSNKPAELKKPQLDNDKKPNEPAEPVEEEPDTVQTVDFTKVPSLLDERFGTLTDDGAVCATKIEVANEWRRKFFPGLLAKVRDETLDADGLSTHKNKAFDLLDSLTKSGGLSIEMAELHCVILSTHCFVKSALHTITRDNINPIEKVEATQLIVASALHGCSHRALVRENQLERVATYSPKLFERKDDNDDDDKEDGGKRKK